MVPIMKSFNVLDRDVDIHRNYLLEASAGTGKTFSIENIIVRLLLEKESLLLEQILVVTFTRAAVRELKSRIRANIDRALTYIIGENEQGIPDFILKIKEDGPQAVETARRKLEQALLLFEQAQIYTIHSFCSRMLGENVFEGNLRIDSVGNEESHSKKMIQNIIKDFFRTGITTQSFSPAQLKLVLDEHSHSEEELQNAIYDAAIKNIKIEEPPHYEELLEEFKVKMRELKKYFSQSQFMEDFRTYAKCFKGMARAIEPVVFANTQHFASLFEKNDWNQEDLDWLISDQLSILNALSENNLTTAGKKLSDKPTIIPLCAMLKRELSPFVSGAKVLIRMAADCKKLINNRLNNEEKLGFDDILIAMQSALSNKCFVERVRSKYKAALVDEFQDTDPLQWEIFKKLFLGSGYLYLVGDPKQSIYAFRQADIYTYLNAANVLGPQNHATLSTNFRSQSDLVHALNFIFASSESLLDLPRLNSKLDYSKVDHAAHKEGRKYRDERGSIHFLIAEDDVKGKSFEEEKLFPFIIKEIQCLHVQHGVHYRDIAILVSDRYQSDRIADFLKKRKIPTLKQRRKGIDQSQAINALKELIKGIIDPKHAASLKLALGGHIIQWDHQQVRSLEDTDVLAQVAARFHFFKQELNDNGFAALYDALMKSFWHADEKSVIERLLGQEDGVEFLDELEELFDIILEYECHHSLSAESLVDYLENFQAMQNDDDNKRGSSNNGEDAVNILTIHVSKGLEYSFVFPIGLYKQKAMKSKIMTVCRNGHPQLAAITDTSEFDYQQHCKEIEAEKLRLLYVAMTRAKHRVYCPVLFPSKAKAPSPGEASPMELLLTKLGIQQTDITGFQAFVDNSNADIQYTNLDSKSIDFENQEEIASIILNEPGNIIVPSHPAYIRSFSALCAEAHTDTPFQMGIPAAPHDFQTDKKTPHNLPSGADVGNLLHKMLEKISFEVILTASKPDDFLSYVQLFVEKSDFAEWKHVLAEVLYNALKTKIFGGFSLSDVDPEKIMREPEFMFLSKLHKYEGYLKGFVDLIFEHQGKYYILDWKSNWLGEEFTKYNHENMHNAMEVNQYHLQAKIYKEALRKFLSIVEKVNSFEDIFGGAYYVFLRGLNIDSGNRYGVYKVL